MEDKEKNGEDVYTKLRQNLANISFIFFCDS